ncbi:hypothetical protein [Mycolicibacter sinensis]|nr:hypothetical protein [Mycolicibacter sinensis]
MEGRFAEFLRKQFRHGTTGRLCRTSREAPERIEPDMTTSRYRRWAAAIAALVAVACLAAGVAWAVRHHRTSPVASADDCAVVAQLAQLWRADSEHSMDALARDENIPLAEADGTVALSAKVRAAAQSVSDPAIKEDLDSWADGFALLGQVIRDDAQRSSPKGPTGEAERIHQAGDLIYLTADKLRAVCPDAFPGRR